MTTENKRITLEQPIKRGNTVIDTIELREPVAGDLRGINLTGLMNFSVDELRKLLPRISTPNIQGHEFDQMVPADVVSIGVKIAEGFIPKKERETMLDQTV